MITTSASTSKSVLVKSTPAAVPAEPLRDVVVAIDAGHGGEDPGAIGPGGTQEKHVVLAIAQRLRDKVTAEPGMRALMIRNGDYFVSLSGRKRMAQAQQADMFVSIHADSVRKNPAARGASVFALSAKGASSAAARWLADRENATDSIGGVSLEDKDDVLTSVLLDLSQSGTIEASVDLGQRVLIELAKVGNVHKGRVEQAGFLVLKSLGIPSLLIEPGFISNRKEDYKLRDPLYQELIANSVMRGIRSYFTDHAPPGTVLAAGSTVHVIEPGETLAGIAQRYQVSPAALRQVNEIQGETLEAEKFYAFQNYELGVACTGVADVLRDCRSQRDRRHRTHRNPGTASAADRELGAAPGNGILSSPISFSVSRRACCWVLGKFAGPWTARGSRQ